jgi:hypothetical protein
MFHLLSTVPVVRADEILFSVVVKHGSLTVIKENKLILSDHKPKQHVLAKREQRNGKWRRLHNEGLICALFLVVLN